MNLDMTQTGTAASTALLAALLLSLTAPALAQQSGDTGQDAEEGILEEVVVTGSRIRRSPADTMAPVGTIGAEQFDERGYITAAQALNDFTANVPALNQAPGDGSPSGSGQQFPNLFGLGAGRTLTLVNGHRFPTTSVGLGDSQVDANIIPTGLIDRIEVVQAGGAAVYGSDAIAGVVNYILKDDYEGLELDAQYGNGWEHSDYEQEHYRLTWGLNFDDGRGNVALNVEYAESPLLNFSDRDRSNLSRVTQGNPADTGPNDGIPSVREVLDAHFWNFNGNGIVYNIPAPPPFALTRYQGTPIQFDPSGNIVPYNPGQILGIPFAQGGDGFRYSDLAGLRTGVERTNATMIGHYDLSDRVTIKGELLYAHTVGTERAQGFARTVLSPAPLNPIMIFNFNPFLTDQARAALSEASPAFAAGAPLWLSRHFYDDLLPSPYQEHTTDIYYGLLGMEGDFDWGQRNVYWTVSASLGRVSGEVREWAAHNARFANAIFAVPGPGGAACLINVDGDPTNDDPACAPINPFGAGNISPEATDYVSVLTGQDFENDQIDFLATMGTTLFPLPGGDVEAVFAYEHRDEEAEFLPLAANRLGLTGVGAMEVPQKGGYDTDEFSAEVLVPLVGADMGVPLVQNLEFNGTYRFVDNSLAGSENVWSTGLRWQVVDDLAFRVTRSRNFRAPTLTQLLAPTSVSASSVGPDPCDADRITGGPNPDIRRANCEAEWAANPQYPDLDEFQDPAENFTVAQVSTGGNQDLRNEISDTWTYGFVLQPSFIPGLTFSVDRIEIDLEDGLSAFLPSDFTATCYDASPQPADICATFTRAATATDNYPAGTIIQAISTTFNAGVIEYEGEYYYLDYQLPLDGLFGRDSHLSFTIDATHNGKLNTSVTGTTFVRTDDTVAQPDWVGRLNARWSTGPLMLSYQLFYLSPVKAGPNVTIESNPHPEIASNTTHSLSAHYDIGERWTVRAGVINFTDEEPSYPTISHGDILGRRWFVGATARF